MPRKPLTGCSWAGCPNPAIYRGRCAIHARKARRAHALRVGKRPYGARWARVRAKFLRYHPVCQATGQAALRDHASFGDRATDVHHRIDRRDGGSDDWSNLQALCHRCHSRETMARLQGNGMGGR